MPVLDRRHRPRVSARVPRPDRHVLYEAAVQGVEYDLHFIERLYRRVRGRTFTRLREDFCGTALLATQWVLAGRDHQAWGRDLDGDTLDWAREHRLVRLPPPVAERIVLERRDVRAPARERVDVIVALNFSYWVFKTRAELLGYFRAARRALRPGGVLVVNAFGGTEAMAKLTETRRIPPTQSVDGERVPGFTYIWEHTDFNPIDHHLRCTISFRLPGGRVMRRAFTYDWRFWTLPEVREALDEAGFARSEVHVEGWNERHNRPDDDYRLRHRFENQEGWVAYVAGIA